MRTLTVDEAAELLHLHPRRVQTLARAGRLPGTRVGRRWLFDRERIESMLETSRPRRRPAALTLSARNRLRGRVRDVKTDGLMAEVTLRIGNQELISLITRSSAERMGLAPGVEAYAVIKSTEVMIGREGKES